jgi:small subunit ribosomal protein S1
MSNPVVAEGYTGQKRKFVQDPWPNLYDAMRFNTILQGKIVGVVDQNKETVFQVDLGTNVRGLILADEMGEKDLRALSFVGSVVAFTVKHCDRANETVYLSRKEALERMHEHTWEDLRNQAQEVIKLYPDLKASLDQLTAAREANDTEVARVAWAAMLKIDKKAKELGPKRTCVVRWVTEKGAHIDIGGVHAFLPRHEMRHGPVRDAREIVQPGDAFDVKIYRVDPESGWVQVSLKALLPDPWESIEQKYAEGGLYAGKTVAKIHRGFLVQLEPGLLCFTPGGYLAAPPEGSDVVVKIHNINPGKRRISGSIVKVRRRVV